MAHILVVKSISTQSVSLLLAAVFVFVLSACDSKKDVVPTAAPSATPAAAPATAPATFDTVANLDNANDPKKLFADPSVSKFPAKDFVYGNGQKLSIEYDGSKSKAGDPVFFDLTMINPKGVVVQVGSDTFDGRTPDRVFSKSNKIFRSEVDGQSGFVEINIVQNSGLDANGKISGKNLMIARFPIKFEASK
jgi:hypothetical protein